MSVWTRQELLENIALWRGAYRAVINGKSYFIGARSLTCQDLDKIRAELTNLEAELDALDGKPTGLGHIIRVGQDAGRWRAVWTDLWSIEAEERKGLIISIARFVAHAIIIFTFEAGGAK